MPVINTAAALSPLLNITAIATGHLRTCVLTTGGGIKCGGYNGYGKLGDGTTTDSPTAELMEDAQLLEAHGLEEA